MVKNLKNYFYCEECEKHVGKGWWKRHLDKPAHRLNLITEIQNILKDELMWKFDTEEDSIGTVEERNTWLPYQELRNTGYFDNIRTLEEFDRQDYRKRVDEILRRNR